MSYPRWTWRQSRSCGVPSNCVLVTCALECSPRVFVFYDHPIVPNCPVIIESIRCDKIPIVGRRTRFPVTKNRCLVLSLWLFLLR